MTAVTDRLRLTLEAGEGDPVASTGCHWPSGVEIMPLATAAGRPPYYISPEPTAGQMMLMSAASASGSCDGCTITTFNQTRFIVGKYYVYAIVCDPGVSLTDINWTIPSTAFSDYTVVNTAASPPDPAVHTAILDPISPSALTAFLIGFYWADAGNKQLQVTFKMNGKPCTLKKTIVVEAPTVVPTKPTTFGTNVPKLLDPNTISYLKGDPSGGLLVNQGIIFEASVETPAYFTNGSGSGSGDVGQWQFVQTVEGDAWLRNASTGNCDRFKTPGSKPTLDGAWPYNIIIPPETVPPWPANGDSHVVSDSPFLSADLATYDRQKRTSTFKMYI
ncbi:MAG: hypothetical protein WD065_15295 [Planctomycetaceae bacterium]